MVHIIASLAFSLIVLGTSAFIVGTLADAHPKILKALGLAQAGSLAVSQRPARIRPAGRWQTTPLGAPRRRAVA